MISKLDIEKYKKFMASQPKSRFKDEYWTNRFSSGGSYRVPTYTEEYSSDIRRSIYNHKPTLAGNISLAWSLKDIPKTQYDRNNFIQNFNQPVIENKSYDTIWYRNNETGYQENYTYDPSKPFPKWIHVNYGALPVVKETFSRWEVSKYDPNKSYIYTDGKLYSADKGFESFLEKHLSKNKAGFFEDVESFYSKKHGKTIVDRDRNVAFNPIGELVVGENITTEFIANSKNIPVLFDKFSNVQIADWRKKWYADKENEIGLDYRGRYSRALTFEEWLVNNSSKVDEDDFEFPDRSEQDFTDYLGRPVTDLDRPERIKLKNIKPLRSYVKPAKFNFDNSSWSAPLVILDTEATDVDATKQVVNIAGIKLRYNFSTQELAVEDAYERWYQPNWSILGYRGMDQYSAKLKYNTSDAVSITGLTTYQLEKQMKAQKSDIHTTFDKKEQMDFVTWAGPDSILIGNKVGYDIDFINKAFKTKHGFDITAVDLIQLAQSTGVLRSELDKLIQKEGRKGRLTVPGLMTWLVNKNYGGEQHLAGADTVDEMKILHELLKRIQNNANQVAWGSEFGIKNLIKQGSSITSKYISHPYNIANTVYEYDEYDSNSVSKEGTVGESVTIRNRTKLVDDLVSRFRRNTDMIDFSSKDAVELKKKLMVLPDKELIQFKEYVEKLEKNYDYISNGNNGAVSAVDSYENTIGKNLSSKTFADVYMPTVYKVYVGTTNTGKDKYKSIRASMLGNDTDDEDLRDTKQYGTDYVDESNWTVDPYNPDENLYRSGLKSGSYVSWQDITELYEDPMYETLDETGLREVRAYRETLPSHLRKEIRWNTDTHKWEVKMHQLTLQRLDEGGRSVEYTYDYSRLDGGLTKIVSEKVYGYGDTIEVDGKTYTVVESKSSWEVNMKNTNLQKVFSFMSELQARRSMGYVGIVDSAYSRAMQEASKLRMWSANTKRPVRDIDKRLQKFVDEMQFRKKQIADEYTLGKKITSDRRNIESQLSSLVSNKVMSSSDADFLRSTYNAEVERALSEGTMNAENYANMLDKVNKGMKDAVDAEEKRIDSIRKANKLLKKISPMYDFNNVYSATYSQINGVLGSAGGVLPNVIMNPARRAGAAIINGLEVDRAKYNYYLRTANTLKGVLTMGAGIAGAFAGGPIGSAVGSAIGAGVGELGVASYNQWLYGKEKKITTMGNLLQNSFNTVGFLKSISGLDVAFSALTKTVKWATLGFIGMVTKGLHSMQSLGNPITALSGVNYRDYQMYGRMDRMFGFAGGTINSSIENFALQQRRMYTYGQMDIDRVVAASMLGVFSNVYANGGDPKANYEATVNKIASGGITDTKLSWAAMIDKTLPQILQIMKDMNANSLQDVYRQSGVTFNELTDEERKRMRRVSFGYRTSLSNISTSWQRMGAALWENGLNKVFDRVARWIETLAQNAGVWMQKINPLIDAFDKLFTAFKSGDDKSIKEAMDNLKKEFGKAFENLKEPITRMVSGISVAMLAGMQTLMPSIAKLIQSLIGEIGKFSFDKDALMHNMNYGTQFPIIRYGEQKGQFAWVGDKDSRYKPVFDSIVNDDTLSTSQKKAKLNKLVPQRVFGKHNYVSTDDYTPIAAISAAQNVIENEAGRLQENEMFEKFYGAMMKAFESFGLTINLKDSDTGNTRKLDDSTQLGAYAIQKAVSGQ